MLQLPFVHSIMDFHILIKETNAFTHSTVKLFPSIFSFQIIEKLNKIKITYNPTTDFKWRVKN